MGNSVIVPVIEGKLQLGRWQSIFFCEFDGPRKSAKLTNFKNPLVMSGFYEFKYRVFYMHMRYNSWSKKSKKVADGLQWRASESSIIQKYKRLILYFIYHNKMRSIDQIDLEFFCNSIKTTVTEILVSL